MSLTTRIQELGYSLPEPSAPGGSYASVNIRGNIAYVAIQFPIINGTFYYQGCLGDSLQTHDGHAAMEMCALNVISQIHHKVGFDRVLGLNHMDAYYHATPTWDDGPKVVDGASDVFVNILGDQGRHSRTILGVAHLPRQFCVGITTSFTLKYA